MKHISYLFVFLSAVLSAQKIQIVDSENGQPIANARILLPNQLLYTNEDGFAPVDESSKDFEVSASGFKKEKIKNFSSVIKLQPAFKDIEEVKIVSVDIKKLFEDVFKNYHKRYYDEPSIYDVVMKQKAFDNNKLHFMSISEAKLWSKTNSYNYKDGYNKKYDDILQLQLNNVKYLKINKSDSVFSAKVEEFKHEYMGNYFFNYELNRTLTNIRSHQAKYSGTLVSEEDGEQLISFKIKTIRGTKIEGNLKYNTADKVITFFVANYAMDDLPIEKKVSTDGRSFDYKYGNAILTFDFYKKDGLYVPALNKFETDNYTMFYKDETHVKKAMREIVYNTFAKSDKKGLDPKVDFAKSIWENIPVKDDKESTVLLSKEEQEFINQK
ncbi:hypothetical protein LNP04_03730 [Chryseobacterium sp. C-71]|uniref:hypothetical protein n=1 Tax=Chryseobacterium sp. C-71 TaxID=2893882 RepID=UPI001E5BE7AC|nr:hypothetical protein [Chryseobacterium sp. C-71]UFH32838.1 hypothetical protein LNP04_03730 [Chryseobacterium sp. C-71]